MENYKLNKSKIFALIPIFAALPVGISWLKLQLKIRRDGRIDQINKQRSYKEK